MSEALQARVAALEAPELGVSLTEAGARIRAAVSDGRAAIEVVLGFPGDWLRPWLQAQAERAAAAEGASLARLELHSRIAAHAVQPNLTPLPAARNLIAVGSGKGGVGKSTTAVNLALALAADGARVGVLDADIYGPSVPTMLGLGGRPDSPDGKTIEPMRAHGVEAMSIGLLVEQDTPMIWRGPMATSALTQLLNETRWGDLDYLVVDLPPGTGDIQLTLAQKIPVAGAVIVTTPQDVATLDARKALKMFEKVQVPVLGLVENMAVHVCSNCGHAEHVFGEGGGQRMAAQYGVPLLGSLPLEIAIREQGDAGVPVVAAAPDSAAARAYRNTARRLAVELARRPQVARPLAVTLR
ncbi:iron-sulfur cluster carrier protein ApbC [Vulcaniibacterium tengchongense]|uniref:Iron-sulfur cluster carrier protein n=1 Tax=Vulcaniibacterium tengchongense TaxID=1273429 RepID=A0A3N4VI63_9GAMM|nr:iron-sulfur cluster carrier protein ApbC [Vulcaniibacterium tengchongense]RPE81373.1 ATP-binding protein involved in chromosome partitioning [Vulcaniibacterium tengchongense]